MTDMRAAKKAAELANAVPGSDGLWDAKDFLFEGTPSDDKAFVQFIADADKAAREVDAVFAQNGYSTKGQTRSLLSAFILPDELDPLLIEARSLVETTVHWSPATDRDLQSGKNDTTPEVKIALAALRRGMELAKEQGK